jgi:catechol 2,3-dioxygenase-like lactoylglutathione lyase family enzyme
VREETEMTETQVHAQATSESEQVIKPTLHHYGVVTSNIEAMVDWYAKVVGFEVTAAAGSPIPSAYVTNDEVHHRGGFFAPPLSHGELPVPRVGVNHVAFEYEGIDDLLTSWTRLRSIRIEPLVMTCHGTHYAFYYKDPDANTVELLADAFGDREQSLAYIKRDVYIQNPMGPAVDPARLIEARDAGVSLGELRERTMAGEFTPETFAGPEVLM